MKFMIGDETDRALCVALKHEFLRCDDAFEGFAVAAQRMIQFGEDRRTAYRTYNAYAWFLHHLYEFMLGAIKRDRLDTASLRSEIADRYVQSHIQRVLTNRREAILNGTAPSWENHISAYPERAPPDVATEWRRQRNVISGHVNPERSQLSLTSFYERNHKFVYILYYECKGFWGRPQPEFPDLDEITAFTVLIKADVGHGISTDNPD
jgi:hypothetical protein